MTELSDEVHDPKALIPGAPDSVRKTAWSMTIYRDLLHEAGEGLQCIDTAEGWSGEAAENFRSMFDGEPKRWLQAGDCFQTASKELDSYSYTLTWAQNQAGEAIQLWQEAQVITEQAAAKHGWASQHAPPDAPRHRSMIRARRSDRTRARPSVGRGHSWRARVKRPLMPSRRPGTRLRRSPAGGSRPVLL